ncbi:MULTISPECIES: hypothetical protein [Burkholderia]|nr:MULTISPECIES: hypothetical protein [Burkholderia]MBN3741890.1 hypothetical protein [Burkholderia sp. Tr-20355]MCA8422271.1 hypothetical protein [Burkholderia seminalis]MCA8432105.1 hypothetical protein [Burkholderia seminalis]QTO19848.1 hypothetical protein DT99_006330 [Burkholderia seminalis]RQS75859.1 hypothetical protein DF032_21800 [Burkholderia seminalis]
MSATGRIKYAVLALAGVAALARAAEPSIPLRVSLTIPETCTIAPAVQPGVDADMPSVSCAHGTPFQVSHVSVAGARTTPPRSVGAGAPAAWTVMF